jgi:hypothetical protein
MQTVVPTSETALDDEVVHQPPAAGKPEPEPGTAAPAVGQGEVDIRDPGPVSVKTARTPRRGPFSTISIVIQPPTAVDKCVAASSLDAVIIFVWSTRTASPPPRASARD